MRIFGLDISRRDKAAGDVSAKPVLSSPASRIEIKGPERFLGLFEPAVCHRNYAFMFHNIGEVQFPIVYIARRAANAKFVLRKSSDDTIVWADAARGTRDRYVAGVVETGLLNSPNPYMSFKEFVFNAFINKLLFGNQYVYADTGRDTGRMWETCRNFYVLPSSAVELETKYGGYLWNDTGITYQYSDYGTVRTIDSSLVYHVKDLPRFEASRYGAVMGRSRLDAQKYAISNIIAVYEARNAIYVKRGALGLIVNQTHDVDGSVALTDNERKNILEDFNSKYGVTGDKAPVAFLNRPVSYIPIGMSIGELQPFQECLLDAAAIAGAYGIDSNLIPRENNPTYSNMNTAELNVYTSVVQPELASWLEGFNTFLGLYDAGYYIDALWDDVAILQENVQRKETAKASVSNRCKTEFGAGLITLNDWRAAIGRERLENALYNKTILEMDEGEISQIQAKLKL